MFVSKILEIIKILNKALGDYKKHVIVLVLFGFISGILEGISVGAAIPLFDVCIQIPTFSVKSIFASYYYCFHVCAAGGSIKFLRVCSS